MKRKEKGITILGLSVLMCSLFLVAIPITAIASEQDDYVLGVYGNANEDDTIDMRDLTYVKLIFFGKKPETELADAKYDGKINPLDFIQIKLIIVGKEKELTVVDGTERTSVTIYKPVERVITLDNYPPEVIRMFWERDKIVGVYVGTKKNEIYFPEISKLPSVGDYPYDPEAVLILEPDLVVAGVVGRAKALVGKFPESIAVVGLTLYKPAIYAKELTKLGYIFNSKDRVDEYLNTFHNKYIDLIKARTKELSEDEKPKVYMESGFGAYMACGKGSGAHMYIEEIAGGRNIFADMHLTGGTRVDPEEVVMRNPDIIIISEKKRKVGYETDDLSGIIAKRDEVMSRPELANVTAIRNGKVYIVSTAFFYGLGSPLGSVYLAKWFHPELFKDLDPQAIHQEYIDRFCPGLDYNVKKHGVFVYHPEEHPDGR